MLSGRKLIEVSLPLEVINQASVYEKFIRTGHPNVLHQWWSRKPLAAARGVLFASLVDDPGEYLDDEEAIQQERERLFTLIEQLVQWQNSYNETVLDKARLEIARSIARNKGLPMPVGKMAILEFLQQHAPPILDPFAGGGSIPLEAQRLGLRAYASDLNPVAVLINKAMIEIPGKFQGTAPVYRAQTGSESNSPELLLERKPWLGLQGMAADLRAYGAWVQRQALKKAGHLYPEIPLPEKYGREKATVVAWLWVRTIICPNPACGAEMPLASKWDLSKKKGREAWIQPVVERHQGKPVVRYTISTSGNRPKRTVSRNGATCIVCGTSVSLAHIRSEALAGRMGLQMTAIALKKSGGRVYLPPTV